MAGDVTRTVRIVYEVDGVEQATDEQRSLADQMGLSHDAYAQALAAQD